MQPKQGLNWRNHEDFGVEIKEKQRPGVNLQISRFFANKWFTESFFFNEFHQNFISFYSKRNKTHTNSNHATKSISKTENQNPKEK